MLHELEETAEIYANGDYKKILRRYRYLLKSNFKSTIYENVFRIVCLIWTESNKWPREYLALDKSGQLKKLGIDDANYIKFYMYGFIADDSFDPMAYQYDSDLVSERTKRFFPLLKFVHFVRSEANIILHVEAPLNVISQHFSSHLNHQMPLCGGTWSMSSPQMPPVAPHHSVAPQEAHSRPL